MHFSLLTQNDVVLLIDATFHCVPNIAEAQQTMTIMAVTRDAGEGDTVRTICNKT